MNSSTNGTLTEIDIIKMGELLDEKLPKEDSIIEKINSICNTVTCPDPNSKCVPSISEDGEVNFGCRCKSGFISDGAACIDIDECSMNIHRCYATAKCINTPGSYTCSCATGYQREYKDNGIYCVDIDECQYPAVACRSLAAVCKNTPGSFDCSCMDGFVKDTTQSNPCVDIGKCFDKTVHRSNKKTPKLRDTLP